MSVHEITVTVNGKQHKATVQARTLLVHFLRETLQLKGTHIGCDTSLCGACTVLLNGKAVKSCTILAVQADEAEVSTVEGLATDEKFHPIQEGFWEEHGLQCGFCTPGLMMLTHELIEKNPQPSDEEVRHFMEGNLCRCTGYQHIVNAVHNAAEKMRGVQS